MFLASVDNALRLSRLRAAFPEEVWYGSWLVLLSISPRYLPMLHLLSSDTHIDHRRDRFFKSGRLIE
jgi:hypothetical protein